MSRQDFDSNLILVQDIMTKAIISVNIETTVFQVAKMMEQGGIGAVLVKEDGHLIRRARGKNLILPLLRHRLTVALGDDFFLLVQQHHVLMQKRRPQHVRQPRGRREREQV